MATKKAKNQKTTKGAKTTMKAKKAKKDESKRSAKTAAEARAEAVEVLDGLDLEARAEAVEAVSKEPPYIRDENEVRALGFEFTGEARYEVSTTELAAAARRWRDAATKEDRDDAAGILARAGWFRPPAAEPAAPVRATALADAPGAPTAAPLAPEPSSARSAQNPDLAALQADVVEAKAALEAAEAEAKRLEDEARAAIAKAKERYRGALAPYRDACRVQGRPCEFEGGTRGANVSERVSFEVEIQGESVRVALRGKPETEEKFPLETVRASPNRIAGQFTQRHVGPKEVVGNKQGTLSNKLRAVLGGAAK